MDGGSTVDGSVGVSAMIRSSFVQCLSQETTQGLDIAQGFRRAERRPAAGRPAGRLSCPPASATGSVLSVAPGSDGSERGPARDDSVIVVGAGVIGLVTALGLAQAGVPVRVLETTKTYPRGAHDMVYQWSVLDGLARLGVLEDCEAKALKVVRWAYRVLRTGERIEFDLAAVAPEVSHPFNLHLGRETMTALLLEHLGRYPGAQIEWGTTVTHIAQDAEGVTVVAEAGDGGRTYRSTWVVGADGARSIVRRELGMAFAGMTWPDRFVATDLRFNFGELGFEAAGYQVDPRYGAVVANVDGSGRWRYIHAENRTLPEETIGERVQEILREVLPPGADPGIERSIPYRIHERSAERFRAGRALLVGDAAHLTNPTSSYGMKSGLFDAYALIEALTAVVVDGVDEEILDRYSEARHRNFWEFTLPTSCADKEFVFPFGSESRQEEQLERLRRIAADPAALREHLLVVRGCETPSLRGEARSGR